MSFMAAKAYLEQAGFGDRVMEFDQSSATVEETAATALYASRFRSWSDCRDIGNGWTWGSKKYTIIQDYTGTAKVKIYCIFEAQMIKYYRYRSNRTEAGV